MRRIRISAPQGQVVHYTNADVIKDAAANMLISAGVPADTLLGEHSKAHWGAGAICLRRLPRRGEGPTVRVARDIIVSTTDPQIADAMARISLEHMRKSVPATGEEIDMAGGTLRLEVDPVVDEATEFIEAISLTPILVSRRDDRSSGKWHHDVMDIDISGAGNNRLSRISGRPVNLSIQPDDLYLSGKRSHSTRVDIKTCGKHSAVAVGMLFPFVVSGSSEDLRLAWYAGIGERNRMGFGFFGLAA